MTSKEYAEYQTKLLWDLIKVVITAHALDTLSNPSVSSLLKEGNDKIWEFKSIIKERAINTHKELCFALSVDNQESPS